MADGVFFVRSRVEDHRAPLRQRSSQFRSAHLGTACDIAEDPIEDVWRLAPIRRRLRLHLRRSDYGTHHHDSDDKYDSSVSTSGH
jgi:hypothetical protein